MSLFFLSLWETLPPFHSPISGNFRDENYTMPVEEMNFPFIRTQCNIVLQNYSPRMIEIVFFFKKTENE